MYSRQPQRMQPILGGFGGSGGKPPRDLIALLAVVFLTYTLQFFAGTAVIPALLRLSPAVWREGWLWQLVTYAFAGSGGASVWFLLELLVLYFFARDVRAQLRRSRFWRLLLAGAGGAALVAVAVQVLATSLLDLTPGAAPFALMQGQRILLVVTIAAFATLNGEAVIYLFFVLPVKARWFLWLGILLAFVAFLGSKDIGGFAGICAGTAITYTMLAPGGPLRRLRTWRLQWQRTRLERKVDRLRRRRNFRVIRPPDPGDPPPTIN